MSIYELRTTSWMRHADNTALTWDELGDRLLPYVAGLASAYRIAAGREHPFEGSWGYQPIGLFAPTSRLGTPEACRRFITRAHAAGIGVIVDWCRYVSRPTPMGSAASTARPCMNMPIRAKASMNWSTLIYNFGRNEVRDT